MTTRPLLLDLYGRAGGAGEGYRRAGFDVVGVDIEEHDYRPGWFIRADALEVLADVAGTGRLYGRQVAVVHASPPCQAFTNAQKIRGNEHLDLVTPTRELLQAWGGPYLIENVVGAPLIDPVMLCGAMFRLRTYRHRLFESNIALTVPRHPEHEAATTKMGRRPKPGEFMHVVGNFSDVAAARDAMGIDWPMRRDDLREAIPPAYTRYLGVQLRRSL